MQKFRMIEIGYDEFWDACEVLPPAIMLHDGFLLGEPYSDRACSILNRQDTVWWAYFGPGREGAQHFKADTPLTKTEFREAIRLLRAGQGATFAATEKADRDPRRNRAGHQEGGAT